ncbi:MAG TPA: hypothetical protein VEU30_02215 [Thermoanaerobaculia bacterium]|nr:hypothetical protein [Thermoanaerobaculia bacterium]
MIPLILLLTTTLVLHSGDQITVEGPVTEENGVVTFRVKGLLYSVPATEIASRGAVPEAEPKTREVRRLTVTAEERDRRLRELEQNRAGVPAPPEQLTITPPPPQKDMKPEERYWRERAREHEEAVRRAQEDLALLESRIEELRYEIRSFISQGFKPAQFSYQTTRLVRTEELLPAARLAVTRAERAQAQFREDARRDGILPGWLR